MSNNTTRIVPGERPTRVLGGVAADRAADRAEAAEAGAVAAAAGVDTAVNTASGHADSAAASALAAQTAASAINNLRDIVSFDEGGSRALQFTTSVGLALMLSTGAFAFTTETTDERPHYKDGVVAGFYLEHGETINGGQFDSVVPVSGDPEFVTDQTRGGSADTQYPGQHAAADRFGTTGKCHLLIQGNANGQCRYNDLTVDVVAGDVVRVVVPVHMHNVPSAASTFDVIRTRQISGSHSALAAQVSFDAAGLIDPDTFTLPSAALDGGVLDGGTTVIGSNQVWVFWMDFVATATATIGYVLREPQAAVGSEIALHEAYFVPNPKGPPSPLPYCKRATTFEPDNIAAASAVEFLDVQFRRLARRNTRAVGTQVRVPQVQIEGNRYSRSRPDWPYEDEIRICRSRVAAGRNLILPCWNAALDHAQLGVFRSPTFFGSYRFADPVVTKSASGSEATRGDITIRGASDTDLLEIPWITIDTSRAHCDSLRIDCIAHSAGSEWLTQYGQVGADANPVCTISAETSIEMQIGGHVSHPYAHGRLRTADFKDASVEKGIIHYVGNCEYQIASVNLTLNNFFSWGAGRVLKIQTTSVDDVITFAGSNHFIGNFSVDGYYHGRGTLSGLLDGLVMVDTTYLRTHFYQSAPDLGIQIDDGTGWQDFADWAAQEGLSLADAELALPTNREFGVLGRIGTVYSAGSPRTWTDLIEDPTFETQTITTMAADGNSGDGDFSGPVTADADLPTGDYKLTLIQDESVSEPNPNFTVTGPDGYFEAGELGVAFDAGGMQFTLASGTVDFMTGDSFTIRLKEVNLSSAVMRVSQWTADANGATSFDTPGYQWHMESTPQSDGTKNEVIPFDTAFISTGGAPASPTNLHIRMVRGNGEYDSTTGVWTENVDSDQGSVQANTGFHSDPWQGNVTNSKWLNFEIRNAFVRARAQSVIFLSSNSTVGQIIGGKLTNFCGLIDGANTVVAGGGDASGDMTIENALIGNIDEQFRFSSGVKNTALYRSTNTPLTLTNCFAVVQQSEDGATENNDALSTSAGGVITGTATLIRSGFINGGRYTDATPVKDGSGNITKPTLEMLVADPETMLQNTLFHPTNPVWNWRTSEYGLKFFGFDPFAPIKTMLDSGINFLETAAFVNAVLHQVPAAHGEAVNTAAIGDEIILYEDFDTAKSKVLRLPGHTIDFAFGDGYGKDGPFEITSDGRILFRRLVTGMDRCRPIITRKPDGTYGPLVTIDITIA